MRVIVPYSAGGGADAAARLISRQLGVELGQAVIIDNKPGAGGAIGANAAGTSRADGYTLLFDAASYTVNPALRPEHYIAQLTPLTQAVVMPDLLVVSPSVPYNTLSEFMAAAKKKDGLTFASYGTGSSAYMLGELFNLDAKLKLLHVPYKGGAPAIADLMAGHVDSYFASAASSFQPCKWAGSRRWQPPDRSAWRNYPTFRPCASWVCPASR